MRNKKLHDKVKLLSTLTLPGVMLNGGYRDCRFDKIISVVTGENVSRVRVVFKDDGSFDNSTIKARTGNVYIKEENGRLIGDF